jgi:hypothetical protein
MALHEERLQWPLQIVVKTPGKTKIDVHIMG